MIRDQIMKIAENEPQFAQAVDIMEEQVSRLPIMPEDLDKEIKMLEFVLQNPDKYEAVRAAAIKDGYISEEQIPAQFDQVFVISLLVALYGLQDRLKQRGYARGGLKVAARQIAAQGRGGDSMLAHINPREAEMLQRMGGAGTINPHTGLHEYKKGGGILGMLLPVALSIIAPGLGTAIGGAIGLSGTAAAMAGGALIGAGTSAITGGNPLLGALTGGIMPVVSGAFSGTDGLFSKMGITGEGGILGNVFGNGNGADIVPTDNPGGWGAGAPGDLSLPTSGSQLPPIAPEGLRTFDASSPLASLATGQNASSAPVGSAVGEGSLGLNAADIKAGASPSGNVIDNLKTSLGIKDMGSLAKLAIPAAMMLSGSGGNKATTPTNSMSASQQEYFNRPPTEWDWNKIQQSANEQGISLSDFIAQNLSKLSGGSFNTPASYNPIAATPAEQPTMAAHGGALSRISNLAKGSGSGRDDTINARLSDGEYVIDAETVALLGDGSTDSGAKRLDEMRKQVRMQKGKALSKGKFSPDAKSPLAYLKGVA